MAVAARYVSRFSPVSASRLGVTPAGAGGDATAGLREAQAALHATGTPINSDAQTKDQGVCNHATGMAEAYTQSCTHALQRLLVAGWQTLAGPCAPAC